MKKTAAGARRITTFAPFIIYLAAFGCIFAQLMMFRQMIEEINYWMDVSVCLTLSDVAVIMIPFALLRPRWRWSVWIPVIGMTLFCYVNLWYCRAFYDLMPLESVGMGGNMQDRVIDAFVEHVYIRDWLLAVPPLIFAVAVWLMRGKWRTHRFPAWAKAALSAGAVLFYGGVYLARTHEYHIANRPQEDYSDTLTRYFELTKSKSYKFTQHISRMGYVGYCLWQLDNVFFPRSLSAADRAMIEDFWNDRRACPQSAGLYSHNNGRNVILLIVESLASDAVGMNINGVDVTPCLDSLMREDSTAISARHVVAQVNHGRSSDGQFIYNTGLLPLRNSVVAKRYPAADYPSLAKALDRPYSFEVIGEKPTFYNHSTTNLSYGYDRLFTSDKSEWLEDNEILDKALVEITAAGKPFFCEITTLTMHDPYNHHISRPTAISEAEGHDPRDINYLEQVHVFDGLLGQFVESLKEAGIYQNTILIIVSDHEPRKTCLGEGLISSDIFFLALNTGRRGFGIDRIVGQIDIFPTILDIAGIGGYRYPGVGTSLIAAPEHHGATDASGIVYGNPDPQTLGTLEKAWTVSELMVEGRYFR